MQCVQSFLLLLNVESRLKAKECITFETQYKFVIIFEITIRASEIS